MRLAPALQSLLALPVTTVGSMAMGRTAHTTTLPGNGKVLVAGSYNGGALLASADM